MAINNYIRPMLEVHQQLEVMVRLTKDRMAACIVGANYDLYRYGYEDLQPITPDGLLADGSQVMTLQYDRDPSFEYEVDAKSVKLYAEGLLAEVGTANAVLTVDKHDPFVLRAPANKLFAWITEGNEIPEGYTALLDGVEVQVGDSILTGEEGADFTAITPLKMRSGVVVDLVGEPVEGSIAAPTVSNSSVTAKAATGDGAVTEDTTFQIAVLDIVEGVVTYQVTDSAGLYTAAIATATAGVETTVKLGLSGWSVPVTFTSNVEAGSSIVYVAAKAPSVSTTKFNGIKLSDTPVSLAKWTQYQTTKLPLVTVCKAFTGWLNGTIATEVTNKEVTWTGKPYISYQDKTCYFMRNRGKIYQEFRVMLCPGVTEDVFTITSVEDIQKYFGTIAVANDLAYGCDCALKGSAGRAIYALRVRKNTPEAYRAALNKVETNTSTYSFAILNEDLDVLKQAVDYVDKRSHPETKRWCRALCGIDSPGEYELADIDYKGNPIKVDIADPYDNDLFLLELDEDTDYDFLDIRLNGISVSLQPGDKIELVSTGAKYTISRVSSSRVLTLENGPTGGVNEQAIRIWKADTPDNAGEYVSTVAEMFNNRRFTVVYCDNGTMMETDADGDYRTYSVPNRFLAATVAGIASAVVPQAPITRTEVTTIDSAARMYTLYTQKDLDNIAKHGVLIVTQDVKNQPCYIRHQLTTETDKGNLYYEESVTRNLDNISYSVVDVLEGYIGKSNVTPSALRSIMNAVTDVLTGFTQDSPNDLIGPSLINWTDLTVEQDPVFKDRVIVRVKLYLPLPLNNIKVYEMAYAADVTI